MDKQTMEARKLANKIVANCMDSPLPLDICMTVLAHLIVDYAVQQGYPLEIVMKDMESMYKINLFANAEKSGAVH